MTSGNRPTTFLTSAIGRSKARSRGLGRGGFGEVYYAPTAARKSPAGPRAISTWSGVASQCLNLKHRTSSPFTTLQRSRRKLIVMEYMAGDSLQDRLRNNGPMPDEAIHWMSGNSWRSTTCTKARPPPRSRRATSCQATGEVGDYGLSKFTDSRQSSDGKRSALSTTWAPEISTGHYGRASTSTRRASFEMRLAMSPDGESAGETLNI